MSEDGQKTHTETGVLYREALERFVREHMRQRKTKSSGVKSAYTLRFSARPHGNRRLKSRQYEIAVAPTLRQLEFAATPQEVEEFAIAHTASVLFELKKLGAVFSGELGDLLNNCDNEGVAIELPDDIWQSLEKMTGKTGDELREHIWRVLQRNRRYWDKGEEIRLPRIAEELLP